MEHIAILGNGISGITAARHIRKLSDKKITVISSETEHFFSRTALMYIYMGHMKFEHTKPYEDWFWKKNNIDLKYGFVNQIDTDNKTLHFDDKSRLKYDKLIIATGSVSNKFGWKGQDLTGVQGLYSKQDLDNLEVVAPNREVCKRAVIIGGGLIGIELAEMLRTRNIPVTFLVRESHFWGSVLPRQNSELLQRHILQHHIDLRLNTKLKEIVSDEDGKVKSVICEGSEEEIPCNFVGLTVGVTPNISVVKDSKIETQRGVLVNRYLETNVENVYAIGDCAQQKEPKDHRPAVEAVWYTGRMMGEVVAQTICGNRIPYNPSHWFNSAKFFDIEYQTYGWVFPNPLAGNSHFHWEHSDGLKGITLEYQTDSRRFLGINTFGIRLKHNIFDSWLTEEKTIDYVIDNLRLANFDPEFYQHFEGEIQVQFRRHSNNLSHA